jgi:hypothetical protein
MHTFLWKINEVIWLFHIFFILLQLKTKTKHEKETIYYYLVGHHHGYAGTTY